MKDDITRMLESDCLHIETYIIVNIIVKVCHSAVYAFHRPPSNGSYLRGYVNPVSKVCARYDMLMSGLLYTVFLDTFSAVLSPIYTYILLLPFPFSVLVRQGIRA